MLVEPGLGAWLSAKRRVEGAVRRVVREHRVAELGLECAAIGDGEPRHLDIDLPGLHVLLPLVGAVAEDGAQRCHVLIMNASGMPSGRSSGGSPLARLGVRLA